MKYLLTFSILVIILILGIFFYPFTLFQNEEMSYDDEQEGLTGQITIRFSHVVAENTPKGLAAKKFSSLVSEKTNGWVKVEVFPNGTLYTDEEELQALMKNNVQMIAPSVSKMTKLAPEWGLFDLPFLFQKDEDVEEALSGELVSKLLTLHEDENIKGVALWSNGFKQMTSSSKELREPEDFVGQRFRIMPSTVIEEQFKQLGAVPIALPYDRVYTSLKEAKFEGQENTISNIYSRRLYELQNHLTISNHGFLGYSVFMNKKFWDGLPSDVQASITEAMEETTSWMLEESVTMNKEQLKLLEQVSTIDVHYLTEQEKLKWMNKLKPVYHKFLKEVNEDFAKEFIEEKMDLMEK